MTNPPVDPHPVVPLTSVLGVISKTLVVRTPVMVTVLALVQVLALIVVVPTVKVVLAMTATPLSLVHVIAPVDAKVQSPLMETGA
jgi:hypothetical protein